MVESKARNGASSAALDLFGKAAEVAFLAELTKAELQTVLDTKYRETTFKVANNGHAVADYVEPPCGGFPLPDDVPIYTELPEGLITVPDAAKKYGINHSTLRSWLRRDYLQLCGRLKAPSPGGGYAVIDEHQLLSHMKLRKGPGRPPN